jgi:acetyltransferase-like isoleucine patch superfamily enzyme
VSILRTAFERYKHFSLRNLRPQVQVARSTRLLRGFGVKFLALPEDRLYVRIGERCVMNADITFESRDGLVEIGDRTYIGNDTHIISRTRVSIGSDVTMAWGITIYDHNSHAMDWRQRKTVVDHFYRTYGTPHCFAHIDWTGVASAPIVIQDRVWIGFGALIMKGVTIGEGAVIGACSVVARDVEPYTVVAGNPAVLIRRLQQSVEDDLHNANS